MKNLDEKETWQAALGELEVILSKANFTTWFKNTFILELNPKNIVIGVPNLFTKEWLENKYHPQIFSTLKKLNPEIEVVTYQLSTQGDVKPHKVEEETAPPPQTPLIETKPSSPAFVLNDNYTFDTYIVGNSNRLAAATAQAVANQPGTVYNPLFIYGGVGLGKTHLVCAIGNEIIRKDPKKKIIYVSCEKFTNDFINSISSGKINDFKKQYRDADVLIVDDIQFLSGKEGTQEEFFHTFNALHQTKRQIIITSDRVPKAIPQLEERLSSRFGWGMIADIQSPNLEMRQAILRSKCTEKNCQLSEDVLAYIAENVESNIRELEGAINRVLSTAKLTESEPDLDVASKSLQDLISAKKKEISIEKIIKIIGDFYQITPSDLLSQKRNKELVKPRQITMYLLRHEMNMSYPKIGKELNKKDHTTIIYGVEKIEKEVARDEGLKKDLHSIKEKLAA